MFWKLIREDRKCNSKSINIAGRRVLLVFRFGQWRMTVSNRFLRVPLSILYRFMESHVRFKYGIELPYTVKLGSRVLFEHQHGIVIHGNAVIGNDCIIRQGVTIGNKSISDPHLAPIIGNNVNIGAGAKILGDVVIGDNVSIGANAVVLTDIPNDCVAVGVPAKIIKKL